MRRILRMGKYQSDIRAYGAGSRERSPRQKDPGQAKKCRRTDDMASAHLIRQIIVKDLGRIDRCIPARRNGRIPNPRCDSV